MTLLDVLPLQAAAAPSDECFGVWVMIERDTGTVVGDVGFIGPPDESGIVEVGYSVIPDRRRRGYATEAALFAHSNGLASSAPDKRADRSAGATTACKGAPGRAPSCGTGIRTPTSGSRD
ncbi:MAG: GNAT family N-acetyltransferase, partial [Gaiellaceae bacterium]